MSGVFISLDGVDGGGKSTQVAMLCDWYTANGRSPISIRDPGGTKLGEALREILLHKQEIPLSMTSEMLLYMASRAQLVEEVIRPQLAAGNVVIADRYLLANIVYQGHAGGLDVQRLREVGRVATGGLQPDLTILLDLDIPTAVQRVGMEKDRLENRGAEYMQQVRDGFLAEIPHLSATATIDATATVEQIHAQIVAVIAQRGLV